MAHEPAGGEGGGRALPLNGWDAGAFAWGFAEATLFFVIPDVLISLVALKNWRRGFRLTAGALAGALMGGFLMFQWAAREGDSARRAVLKVPMVRARMLDAVDREYRTLGPAAILRGPATGKPYKLYAVAAGRNGASLSGFLMGSVPGRLWRFLLTAGVAALLGRAMARAPRIRLVVWALFWAVTYLGLARMVQTTWGS